jgi:uncharacterized integral membrane protein
MRREGDMDDGRGGDGKDWVASKEGPGAKTIVAIVAIVVLVVFALQNTDEADIDFLTWDAGVALWVVIVIAAVLGFVIGWLLGRASGKRRAIERIVSD